MVYRADLSQKAVYFILEDNQELLILDNDLSDEETGQIINGYITENIKKADSSIS